MAAGRRDILDTLKLLKELVEDSEILYCKPKAEKMRNLSKTLEIEVNEFTKRIVNSEKNNTKNTCGDCKHFKGFINSDLGDCIEHSFLNIHSWSNICQNSFEKIGGNYNE